MTLVHASTRMVFLIGVGLLITQFHCTGQTSFECGIKSGDPASARLCNRPHEVCVCATNSCAFRDSTKCPVSGLRYSESPFAREDLAGDCVDSDPGAWIIEENPQPQQELCPVRPDAGYPVEPEKDAGLSGSTSSSGMAGMGGIGGIGGMGSSSTGGAGGMGTGGMSSSSTGGAGGMGSSSTSGTGGMGTGGGSVSSGTGGAGVGGMGGMP